MPFLGLIVAAVVAAVVGGGAYGTYNYYNNGRGDYDEVRLELFILLGILLLFVNIIIVAISIIINWAVQQECLIQTTYLIL